jgi:peptidoglycan/xylan/chitin deacetylase (PgdA/CDA1 family)
MKPLPHNFHERFWIGFSATLLLIVAAGYFSYQPTSGLYGNVFSHAITNDKVIALTFDDGPNGTTTNQVLDILKKENVKATFFLVGDNVTYYPEIAKRISDEGYEIGNHTTHHVRSLPLRRSRLIQKDLRTTNDIIFAATGQTPKFFRPPFGFRTPWALDAAEAMGLIPTTWSDQAHDYEYKDPKIIVTKIMAGVKPGRVIVLHDGDRTIHGVEYPALIQALPTIIENLKSQGYQFLTMSELYKINHQ